MPNFAEQEDTVMTEPSPPPSPQTEEVATIERNETAEPGPTTQEEVDVVETSTPTEQGQGVQPSNDAATDTTLVPNQNIRMEPNIMEIL